MKRITEIKAQVKTPTRCNIYLDGAYYCALELETVMKNRLKAGVNIEEEELDRLQAVIRAKLRGENLAEVFLKKPTEDFIDLEEFTPRFSIV